MLKVLLLCSGVLLFVQPSSTQIRWSPTIYYYIRVNSYNTWPSNWEADLITAAEAWRNIGRVELVRSYHPSVSVTSKDSIDQLNIFSSLEFGPFPTDGEDSVLATAVTRKSYNKIRNDSTIRFVKIVFDELKFDNFYNNDFSFRKVATHEYGHMVGLQNSGRKDSFMNKVYEFYFQFDGPQSIDSLDLVKLYSCSN